MGCSDRAIRTMRTLCAVTQVTACIVFGCAFTSASDSAPGSASDSVSDSVSESASVEDAATAPIWKLRSTPLKSHQAYLLRKNSQSWIPFIETHVTADHFLSTQDAPIIAIDPSGTEWLIGENQKGRISELPKQDSENVRQNSKALSQRIDLLQIGRTPWLTWRTPLAAPKYSVLLFETPLSKEPSQVIETNEPMIHISRLPTGAQTVQIKAGFFSDGTLDMSSLKTSVMIPSVSEFNLTTRPDPRLTKKTIVFELSSSDMNRIHNGNFKLTHSEASRIQAATEGQGIQTGPDQSSAVLLKIKDESGRQVKATYRFPSLESVQLLEVPIGISEVTLSWVDESNTVDQRRGGESTHIETLLPPPAVSAQLKRSRAADLMGYELNVKDPLLVSSIAGYEFHLSSPDGTHQKTIRTKSKRRWVAAPSLEKWTVKVKAIDHAGHTLSRPTVVSLVTPLDRLQKNSTVRLSKADYASRSSKKPKSRSEPVGSVLKSKIQISWPKENDVVVAYGNAKTFGQMKWKSSRSLKADEVYAIEIAEDGDFERMVIQTTSQTSSLALSGDLPEGALFARVKIIKKARLPTSHQKRKGTWSGQGPSSQTRRFELVYE